MNPGLCLPQSRKRVKQLMQLICLPLDWYEAKNCLMRLLTQFLKLQELEQNWAEPLHEYSQFASIIKKLLAYRHQKHVQYEMTQDGLEHKREQLAELEKSEREARRLDAALGRGRANGGTSDAGQNPEQENGNVQDPGEVRQEETTPYLPPHPGPNPARRRSKTPGMGLLSALSYTLHGMMDVDPETSRRNSITKTRETISQVRPNPIVFSCHPFITCPA